MIRDWELIRTILVAAETKAPGELLHPGEIDSDPKLVVAHMEMLHDAGYVEANFLRKMQGTSAHVVKVTYAGYDLLDTLRSDTTWSSIKKVAKSKGLELTFEVVKQIGSFVTDKLLKGEPIPGI
jgi:hypothetical protein